MAGDIPVQTYRDFAENRGIFKAGATNVTIDDANGNPIGIIPSMMKFRRHGGRRLVGAGRRAIVPRHRLAQQRDGPHLHRAIRRDRRDAILYDTYHIINYNRAWGPDSTSNNDYAAPRLNKIVTEAVATNYLTDPTILNNMIGQTVLRVGGGDQAVATGTARRRPSAAPTTTSPEAPVQFTGARLSICPWFAAAAAALAGRQ